MARNTWWDVGLVQHGDIQVLVDIGDIDAGGAWEAVVAVNAMAFEVALEVTKHGAVVPLAIALIELGYGFKHVFPGAATDEGAHHRRPGQGIVYALGHGQGLGEGRLFRGDKFPGPKGLHHRDGDSLPLAELVQGSAVTIQFFLKVPGLFL